jgi:hypothetical protein
MAHDSSDQPDTGCSQDPGRGPHSVARMNTKLMTGGAVLAASLVVPGIG